MFRKPLFDFFNNNRATFLNVFLEIFLVRVGQSCLS